MYPLVSFTLTQLYKLYNSSQAPPCALIRIPQFLGEEKFIFFIMFSFLVEYMQFQASNSKTFAVDRGVMENVNLISFVQGWLKVTSSNSTYGLIDHGQKIYHLLEIILMLEFISVFMWYGGGGCEAGRNSGNCTILQVSVVLSRATAQTYLAQNACNLQRSWHQVD